VTNFLFGLVVGGMIGIVMIGIIIGGSINEKILKGEDYYNE
jgi:hypothetical protein